MTVIKHYGTPRHSGRYPWGSGEDGFQRNPSFLGQVKKLQDQGLSEVEIAKGFGITTSQLRAQKSIAKAEQRKADLAMAIRLKDKGMSNVAIGQRMGLNESSVRSLLDPTLQERSEITRTAADLLKENVESKGFIDVGAGVETYLGLSRTKLNTALALLEDEGYQVHTVKVKQVGTGKDTTIKVLAPKESTYSDLMRNRDQIKMIDSYFEDHGRTLRGLEPIRSISSDRIKINYDEDGGTAKDGLIELRRGVDDISLGNAKYAQVRIGVDGTHYLKGMAVYSDALPKGVDVLYNTNKSNQIPKEKVFKSMKEDPDNPFGASVRQRHYIDKDGKEQLSSLNIVNEEGDWQKWSKSISSQVLSKQSPSLAKKQLGLAFDLKKEEYDEINALTNPSVKKRLLESFSDDCDAAAVHLKAAALPRQSSHVILPFPSLKENEIYAPNYQNGDHVVLIRHPHGGIFEIPELVVNNKASEPNSVIKNAIDAVGINPKVASKLSGADFDGDTVLVIPNKNKEIKTSASLKGLENFDPKTSYPSYPGMKTINDKTKQLKMGDISNLITDMTIKGANLDEIARAVRHSMVVIDAEKHSLNYKQSYIDNGISSLKEKYQGSKRSGASTLISKASSEMRVPHRKDQIRIDPLTGKKVYEYTNESYINKDGKVIKRTSKTSKMAETDNAFNLSSGTRMETVYAEYANSLKSLANKARKDMLEVKTIPYSPSARLLYSKEVASLKAKLNIAFKNKPLERQAQLMANKIITTKRKENPDMDAADLKKLKGQVLEESRSRFSAKKQNIEITNREWEAIQLGAISSNTLNQILLNTDLDSLKQRSMPRQSSSLSSARLARAKNMLASGYTQAEVASALGISTSYLTSSVK